MRGFTIVELITVVLILGILSMGTVRFVSDASNGFASTLGRAALADEGRFVVDRLTRELRDALPASVRASGSCLEFLPVLGATRYLTAPVAVASASLSAVPVDPLPAAPSLRAVIQPDTGLYSLAVPGAVSPPATLSPPDAANRITITFTAPHRFVSESADGRLYLVDSPRSYCASAGRLWRYDNYGYQAVQPAPAGLPAALPDRVLVAEGVTASFAVSAATLTRNALIQLDVEFTRAGDRIAIRQEVQVRNVP